jgi:hypothetical protein
VSARHAQAVRPGARRVGVAPSLQPGGIRVIPLHWPPTHVGLVLQEGRPCGLASPESSLSASTTLDKAGLASPESSLSASTTLDKAGPAAWPRRAGKHAASMAAPRRANCVRPRCVRRRVVRKRIRVRAGLGLGAITASPLAGLGLGASRCGRAAGLRCHAAALTPAAASRSSAE